MVTRTKNLNHVRVMQVEETQTFTVHPENSKWYVCSSSLCLWHPPATAWENIGLSEQERFWSDKRRTEKTEKVVCVYLSYAGQLTYLFYVTLGIT